MKCPSCGKPLELAGERCPHCSLTLRRLDLKFGTIPRHAAYVTDRTERVPLEDVLSAREELRLFARRFPQCVFSVFIIELAPGASASEYAFWLANRARFTALDAVGADNFDLLLVIDMTNGNAALAAGYGLEEFVTDEELAKVLDGAAGALSDGDILAAVRECAARLSTVLKDAAERQPELETVREEL